MDQDFNQFSNWLFSLNAYEFTLIPTIIGFILGPTLTTNQQNSLGNFFDMLGQVLMTMNAQNITLEQSTHKNSTFTRGFQTNSEHDEILLIKDEIIRMFHELYGDT